MPDPYTPEWWLKRLEEQLNARLPAIIQQDEYYRGEHPLAFASSRFRQAFGGLFDNFADNWVPLVVDAAEERLNVEGFRFGKDKTADRKAWRIWQTNQLDADSQIAHTEAIKHGEASALVWNDGETTQVTVEAPHQMIVAREAGSRRRRAAALKRWFDEEGYWFATLYLPDFIYKYRSERPDPDITTLNIGLSYSPTWAVREVDDETWPLANPLGVVPVVPLVNQPDWTGEGQSDVTPVIPLQNAVNKLMADMLIASEFGAFRQRWATGLEVPKDPDTGQPIEPFKSAIDRLWTSKSQNTKFGEFGETNLDNFVKAIDTVVQHVASQTRTPPHYLNPGADRLSGESIKAAETGLVAKCRRKMRHFGEGWEEVIRLAFLADGDRKRASIPDAETIWGDPESRSEAQHIDAVTKQKALNVPDEILWEKAGYTPPEIERMIELRRTQPAMGSEQEDGRDG